MHCNRRERGSERGSALLIVFLFAAFVAIMLYEEMPVMAFEAQRAKEQLLIDRGNQYKQAVKVYWTHFQGRFPPDINGLESTNSIRFLRHRYKDPFTGKDDWRLLHMAPGGMGLIDSKVTPAPNVNQNGSNQNSTSTQSTFGQTSNFGSNGTSGSAFGTNAFGGQSAGNPNSISGPVGASSGFNSPTGAAPSGPEPNNVGGPPVYAVPQRPPAIAAGGAPNANGDPNDPNNPNNQNGGQMSASFNVQQNPNGPPLALPGQTAQAPNGSLPNQPPNAVQQIYGMMANQGAQNQPAMAGAAGQTGASTTTSSAFTSSFSNSGLTGMFAGVASIAQGHGIKIIHDQHDYAKWEFWFNPQEATTGANGIAGATQNNQTPNNSANNANGQSIGGSNSSSVFGNSAGVFSTNTNNAAPTAPATPQPQQ